MAVLAGTPVLITVPSAQASVTETASAADPPQNALAQASDSGQQVEVVEERTEYETTFANPDGATFTLEKSITPVRVEKPGGGWQEPDATLVKRADGSIGPKAATVDLTFSPGGKGNGLVTIGEDRQTISLGWPGALPAPMLDGERAVYENVLPDVNLIMTATVEGFRQVLEVETPEAAANPELKSIEYSMEAEGLTVRTGAVGTMEALDGNGRVVFRSPTAQMWNSAGNRADEGVSTQSLAVRPLSASTTPAASQSAESAPVAPAGEGDPLAGPGDGDEAAVMDVVVSHNSLTVTPDAGLIEQTAPADFPVYIDPAVNANKSERTVLSSDGDVFYNFSGGDNGMSVGRCGSAVIGGTRYYCTSGTPYTNRMYYEFTAGNLKGKHVLDAEFTVTETWSFSCDARWVDLERTDGISASTKWPGPGGPKSDNSWDQMGDRNVSHGRGSACSPSQPRAPVTFSDYAPEPDENLTPTVRDFAAGKFSTLTLMLKAKDESDAVAWKRFDDDAVLRVIYVGKPAVPTEYGLETGTGQVCSKDSAKPTVWSDPTPNLAATPQTASGGESGAMLRAYFDIDVKNTDGSWSDFSEPTSGSLKPTSGHVGDGADQNKTWDVSLADGKQYRYAAYTRSYYDTTYAKYLGSSGSPFCYFTIDSAAPKPPTITFNSVYSACLPGSCVPGGKPGAVGQVTFGPAAGTSDVNVAYAYKLTGDAAWRPWKPGATVTENIVPTDSGTVILNVMTKDSLNRTGENTVRFLVGEGGAPLGKWSFNETSGVGYDLSATTSALRDDVTLAGASRTSNGRRGVVTEKTITDGVMGATTATGEDKGLWLANSAYGSTSGKVLETQASYTVAAWVRLDTIGRNFTVLGQDGTHSSPFFLGYCESVNRWCFRLADADAAVTSLDNQRADSKQPASAKVWTHLAGVVDTQSKKLHLYVNGVLQNSDDLTTGAWSSSGPLQIGRVKHKSGYVDHFAGEVDEVTVWQEAKTAGDIARDANPVDTNGKAYAELVAHYNPEAAASGATSLTDLSNYSNTVTLGSGASLDGTGLVLNGSSGSATAPRRPVDDTGSFTVATEVAVTTSALASKPDGYRAQIMGQRTATGSSWGLWLEKTGTISEPVVDEDENPVLDENGNPVPPKIVPVGRWHFGRLTADGTGTSVASDTLAALDTPVGLVGTFDSRTGQITLYVGSEIQGDRLAYTAQAGTGELSVGQGWLSSAWGNFLPGRITDIRLWAGAVTDETQVSTVVGY
ncbi:LamG domain-containing protein [Streptomyces sp. NBC_01237]|uniref:LamG domain-containing protein n=1 Tax=Streptomyces sp. NBC_01237 TaxID=2903790 RepID=UPI002DDA9DDC|nr:LamG domain-containing protein [Streptomyces sp. NBC_01237]WRZ76457.1 LamG domain-containing protein [Streptomyces sp. NBC_01237]